MSGEIKLNMFKVITSCKEQFAISQGQMKNLQSKIKSLKVLVHAEFRIICQMQ